MIRIAKEAIKRGYSLRPFQEEGVNSLINSPSSHNYLADAMGLGKSIQALAYANAIGAESLLIICPASLRLNWLREASIWYDVSKPPGHAILKAKDVTEIERKNQFVKGYMPSPLIVSYDLMANNANVQRYIFKRNWNLVVIDEAHAIKNLMSKRTQACLSLWDKVPRVLLLSGTPMTTTALDLFPPLYMIVKELDYLHDEDYTVCSDFESFTEHFTYIYNTPFGIQYKGARNVEHLKSILRERGKFFIRRTKEQVLKDLPEKTYSRVDLDLTISGGLKGEALDSFCKSFSDSETSEREVVGKVKKHFATFRRELGEAKASCKETYDIIDSIIAEEDCCVVFFYHRSVRDILKEELRKRKYKVALHDGATSAILKQKAVDDFQSGRVDILLAQAESAQGYTATAASSCVFIEYPWLSTQVNQAVDRIHRMGQLNAVVAYFVVSTNSFDRELVRMIIQKQKMIDKVLGD